MIGLEVRLLAREKLRQQAMKMMNAVFAFHGVTTLRVCPGAQASLHRFTNRNVFVLDFIAELDGAL